MKLPVSIFKVNIKIDSKNTPHNLSDKLNHKIQVFLFLEMTNKSEIGR